MIAPSTSAGRRTHPGVGPSPLNILQILPSAKLGGAGLIALRVAEHLLRPSSSWSTSFWCPGPGPLYREAEALGLGPRPFDPSGVLLPGLLRPAVANAKLVGPLLREGPGLAHIHSPYLYAAIRPALRLAGLKAVVHVHLAPERDSLRWAFRRPPELIVACSRSLVDSIRESLPAGLRDRQWIEAVPNAVDSSRFRPGDRAASKDLVGAPSGMPMALMLANLAPHKGQETAIRAIAVLKRRGIDLACWLAGVERQEEGYTERLRDLIDRLGVGERVRLLGQRADSPELLRAADLFLLPSTNEGLPLSILEAQASRVPVIAAPTAGVPEIVIDGETGYLVPADDVDGYADRIAKLLSDPEAAERVAANAHRLVLDRHGLTSYCRTIEGLYERVA